MFRNLMRFTAVVAILVISIGVTGAAQAKTAGYQPAASAFHSANQSITGWFTTWADGDTKATSINVGSYLSAAYNPMDGKPYISYYDAVSHNLMLTNHTDTSNDAYCGTGKLWWCRDIDGLGHNGSSYDNVGEYSSIAFWQGTTSWKLGISYHDTTTHALKLALFNQTLLGWSWNFYTIQSTSTATYSGNDVGLYTSIKFTSAGIPIIAYYRHVYSVSDLSYYGYLYTAKQVASGGNCGVGDAAGLFQCEKIDGKAGEGVGQYASLDLDYYDYPYISYYDAVSDNLRFAQALVFVGGGNCGTGGDTNTGNYECYTVDAAGDVGRFTSIVAPHATGQKTAIAYYDKTNGYLMRAIPWTGGTGCNISNWYCGRVYTIGANLPQVGISMARDNNGREIIAFQDASDDLGPAVLRVARPVEATGSLYGNCGDTPSGYLFQIWMCELVDNAAYGYGNVSLGDYVSVAANGGGVATIAYSEYDSYVEPNTFHLKVAYYRLQTFLPLNRK
jgi:hypothetical protein